VKQDQGLTFPVNFILHVEAVHLSIAPFAHGHAGSAFRVGIFSAKREREAPSEKELSLCRTLPFKMLNTISLSAGRTKPPPQKDAFSC
jgi:hypothetical protein